MYQTLQKKLDGRTHAINGSTVCFCEDHYINNLDAMDAAGDSTPKCFWNPIDSKKTNFDFYRDQINKKYEINLATYQDLYKWSVDNYAEFWEEFWQFSGLKYSHQFEQVIDKKKCIADIPEWFHGSKLNFAENLLQCKEDNKVAIYAAVEGRTEVQKRTFGELRERVAQFAEAMKKLGVKSGDRVVGYIPNCIEAIEAMLAASSIGAIWSSTSPEFGVAGVLDRFTQIKPKLLFSVNAVVYNGKTHNHMEKLEAVVQGLPDLEMVVVIPYIDNFKTDFKSVSHINRGCDLDHFLSKGKSSDGSVPELSFEQLPFNHPLFIMYSSGTTGQPKCIVHSAGGTLLKHLEEHKLQGNMSQDDVMMYYTTTGWMMWNWFVSALAVGASIVCYDGSPLVPSPDVLWDLIDQLGITILGTGAKWLAVLEEKGVKPGSSHKLTSLHTILSTGSPLKPQSFEYVYRDIKADLVLGSITGGTDIIGCFAGHSWSVPVYKGEIQCRMLGMAMEAWDEGGSAVYGESGELVCTKPFPSMPVCFWNDPDGEKYKKAYFMKFPGIWAHGDFCQINPKTMGVWMLGRSDGTLNPNGVRFGSAEIYHITEAFTEVQDSLCVAQKSKDGLEERVVLFLQMKPDHTFNDELVKTVRQKIRQQLSARHIPALVLQTADIPYTNSNKKVEIAVKKIIAGEEVKARGTYSNPDSLDLYSNLPELQGF